MKVAEVNSVSKGKEYRRARTYVSINGQSTAITASWKKGVTKREISRELANRINARRKRALDESKGITGFDLTVSDALKQYIRTGEIQKLKPATIEERVLVARVYIAPALGGMKLTDSNLGRSFNQFIERLSMEKNHPTIQQVFKIFNGMINWAKDNQYAISENPIMRATRLTIAKQGKHYRATKPKMTEISLEDIANIMKAVAAKPEEIVFHMMAYHGLRASEALGMKWENIDLDKEIVRVSEQASKYNEDVATTKTENGNREIPLDPETKNLMARLIADTPMAERTGYIFSTANGKAMIYQNFRIHKYLPVVKPLGLLHIKPHKLRYFFASVCVNNGVPFPILVEWMGHADEKMILTIYAKKMAENNVKPNISGAMKLGMVA